METYQVSFEATDAAANTMMAFGHTKETINQMRASELRRRAAEVRKIRSEMRGIF